MDTIKCQIIEETIKIKTDAVMLGGGSSPVTSVFGRLGNVTAQSGDYSKSDVGLGNVDNTADADKPISTDTQTALDSKADNSALTSHTGNTSNPHTVTKTQIGLENVDNTSDLNKPISDVTQTALDLKADGSALTNHTGDSDNPHTVTKSQIGLENVDNTSDADKPVSTATQTALNLKSDKLYDYIVTAGDWSDLVTALESGTYATVFIPEGTYTCTDNEVNPITVHANVKRISGERREGTIIDADCSTNSNIQNFITCHYALKIENINVINFGNGVYSCFMGAGSDGYYTEITTCYNCRVENFANSSARAFSYCSCLYCEVENPVSTWGIGTAFYQCHRISNCTTRYCDWVCSTCYSVSNCLAYKTRYGFNSVTLISNCIVNGSYRGFYNCDGVSNCHAISCSLNGYDGCDNMSDNNKNTSNSTDFYNCTFNNKIINATDNTKESNFNNDNQTSGTSRTFNLPDLDGQMIVGGASVTPANNGEIVVEATNNTTLTFKLKGSDGTVRTGTLTLS